MMEYVWMVLAGFVAFSTGRGIIRWTIATAIFGWFTLIPLVLMPKNMDRVNKRLDYIGEFCDKKIAKQQFKNVDNVDDLFKQLETK